MDELKIVRYQEVAPRRKPHSRIGAKDSYTDGPILSRLQTETIMNLASWTPLLKPLTTWSANISRVPVYSEFFPWPLTSIVLNNRALGIKKFLHIVSSHVTIWRCLAPRRTNQPPFLSTGLRVDHRVCWNIWSIASEKNTCLRNSPNNCSIYWLPASGGAPRCRKHKVILLFTEWSLMTNWPPLPNRERSWSFYTLRWSVCFWDAFGANGHENCCSHRLLQ